MAINVCKAKGLPDDHPLALDALPKGFFYLVDSDTEQIIEPVLKYLCYQFLFKQGRWRANTVEAIAYDLAHWWNYLEKSGNEWFTACLHDVVMYRNHLLGSVSPRTERGYSTSTINRRLIFICQFYDWASTKLEYKGDISLERNSLSPRNIDQNMLAHLGAEGTKQATAAWLKVSRSEDDLPISPISVDDWHKIARSLGPLPSQAKEDQRPCRDRVAAEFAVLTGLRVSEVASIEADDVLKLPDSDDQFSATSLLITKTKGGRPRKILIPNFFLPEIKAYILGERALAVSRAASQPGHTPSKALFVNHAHSSRRPGCAATADTLSRSFKAAVLAACPKRKIVKTSAETQSNYIAERAKHTFHDLRHTFAMWMYQAELEAGNQQPWKVVQNRLGHAQLLTTLNTYLATVDAEKASFSRKNYEAIKAKSENRRSKNAE